MISTNISLTEEEVNFLLMTTGIYLSIHSTGCPRETFHTLHSLRTRLLDASHRLAKHHDSVPVQWELVFNQ